MNSKESVQSLNMLENPSSIHMPLWEFGQQSEIQKPLTTKSICCCKGSGENLLKRDIW